MSTLIESGRFLGSPIRSHVFPGVALVDAVYGAGRILPAHAHEAAYFCWIRAGGYHEKFGSRERECVPSTVAFHPAGERHAQNMGPFKVLSFNVELDSRWVSRTGLCLKPREYRGGPVGGLAARLYREFCEMDDVSDLVVETLLLELAAAVRPHPGFSSVPWIEKVRRLLDEQFLDTLTLGEIAAQSGVAPSTLAQAFRRRYRCTPGDYLRNRRLVEAKRLLATTRFSICEIATRCRFTDQSHLTRLFKRVFGTTPASFRNAAQPPLRRTPSNSV